jgi:hypothetical protein
MKDVSIGNMYFNKLPQVKTLISDDKLNVIGIFKNQLISYELKLN